MLFNITNKAKAMAHGVSGALGMLPNTINKKFKIRVALNDFMRVKDAK